ncbi:hypothetical protein INP77_08430 [Methylophilus sp. 13]|uniref:hypothetical protein n=1 Tax=Methylophilus sp. 13 TaxID=2781018 RepID=UPI00188F7647|nr:hypothetical protein [Methylophilus sp. 13]MBF5039514.1 hypothetical protein [Methylophilus sp. 13]
MTKSNLGNQLYFLVTTARDALFDQGELAQLTYGAFDVVANNVTNLETTEIEISFPVGYRADHTAILSQKKYTKEELLQRYQFLAHQQMPINGIAQLVSISETLLGDIVRNVIMRYPQKLGNKRSVQLSTVLEAQSLEEIHLKAMDTLLNELSYKSPNEFSDSFKELTSITLLECPAFHKYIEMKATRDIHVHNRGVSNKTYLKKAGSHARAKDGQSLPVDIPYFLESYEACIQITEWLEQELDERWHSTVRESIRNNSEDNASKNNGSTEHQSSDAIPLSDISLEDIAKPKKQRKKKTKTPAA